MTTDGRRLSIGKMHEVNAKAPMSRGAKWMRSGPCMSPDSAPAWFRDSARRYAFAPLRLCVEPVILGCEQGFGGAQPEDLFHCGGKVRQNQVAARLAVAGRL